MRHTLWPLAPWFFVACLLGAFSWQGSILGSDDALYAMVARENLRQGEWLSFTFEGRPFFEKGPVLPWLLMGSQAMFGESEFAQRLPGILFAFLLLLALYHIAIRAGMSRLSAWCAVASALAMNAFYLNARRPMSDIPGAALALLGLALVMAGGLRSAAAGGALLGLSILTKLVAPIPVLGALLFSPLGERPYRRILLALLVACLVALPWHGFMLQSHGQAFADTYFAYHLLERATTPLVGQGGPGVYLDWLVEREPLIAPILGAALLVALWRRDGPARLALALFFFALAPLALSATALPHYLVATVPGAALSIGVLAGQGRIPRFFLGLILPIAFVWHNARDMVAPDYSSGAREACEAIASWGRTEDLIGTADIHDLAVPWYCARPAAIFVVDKGLLAALASIPVLQGKVYGMDPALFRSIMGRGGLLITRPDRMEGLQRIASAASMRLQAHRYKNRLVVAALGGHDGTEHP